jgi:hypothetical protein
MKRSLAVALSLCGSLAAMSTAHADWSAGAGFENFRWQESTAPRVKESGLRWALDLGWTQTKDPGLSVAYQGEVYHGNVDYDGATLFGNVPISGETHYRGFKNELQAWYRTPGLDYVLGFGWDHWDRDLSSAQTETWNVGYARLGLATPAGVRQGFIGGAGVKYTVYTRENGNLQDIGAPSNPRLRPKGDFSAYATLGYRVNADWDVLAYYDSLYFKQSNVVVTGGIAVLQPRSRQDVVGLRVLRNF